MSQTVRLGIIGAGWPGRKHAEGAKASGGYKLASVADLIPARRAALMSEFGIHQDFDDAAALIKSADVDAVSICVPNNLHAKFACDALRAGKHVIIEKPPTTKAAEAKKIATAAEKAGKVVMYAFQRRFGPAEQAAKLAVSKGYAGNIYHARATWLRTRGIPAGTGWYGKSSESGGGAMIDLGAHVLDLAWWLLGEPKPQTVFAVSHARFKDSAPDPATYDVEDFATALVRFEGGATLELSASWALDQPPQQQGTQARIFGDGGCVDVYTPSGAILHRQFDAKGQSKPTELKSPRLTGHAAMMRRFRECILGKAQPSVSAAAGVTIMEMIDAIYRSAASGKSVSV